MRICYGKAIDQPGPPRECPENRPGPKSKGSSSNHPFSIFRFKLLVSGKVCDNLVPFLIGLQNKQSDSMIAYVLHAPLQPFFQPVARVRETPCPVAWVVGGQSLGLHTWKPQAFSKKQDPIQKIHHVWASWKSALAGTCRNVEGRYIMILISGINSSHLW